MSTTVEMSNNEIFQMKYSIEITSQHMDEDVRKQNIANTLKYTDHS